MGRAFYSYADRYLITANFRADASSRFTKDPWGFFPSVALAWRMSEEAWLKEVQWIDNLKLRVGFGQAGNDGIPSGSFIPTMGSGDMVFYGYPLGYPQVMVGGAAVLTQVNTAGKWETNEQWDAGIDFSFWNGKLSGTIDYFLRDTKDALLYVNAPAHVGNRNSLIKNVGNIRNTGVEIALDHKHHIGKFHYNIGGNISFLHNELTAVNGGSPLWGDRTKTDQGWHSTLSGDMSTRASIKPMKKHSNNFIPTKTNLMNLVFMQATHATKTKMEMESSMNPTKVYRKSVP